jgi:hypothetical protein
MIEAYLRANKMFVEHHEVCLFCILVLPCLNFIYLSIRKFTFLHS